MMKGKKTGPNISVSHVIESFILSLPPVFDILVIFFFLNYCSVPVPQQEHSRNSVLQNLTWPILILNTHIKQYRKLVV